MSGVESSLSRMAPELWLEILNHFVPSGAPTTVAIQPSKAELRPHVLEYRRTLWAACQVSRQVGTSARIRLYQAVLISSCKELLYFFRTLRTVPELRILVRSFSWTGTLPQSDADDAECVDLMPSLIAVFASLPPPVTAEDAWLHRFLHADNLAAFRVWRLLGVILAILPKLATLFLVMGRLMPGPRYRQHVIDTELGGAEAEARGRLVSFRQQAFESLAIRVLVMDPVPTSIGYPLLPELQVLVLDHISNVPPLFEALDSPYVVDDLKELCPQLRYIQTKSPVHPSCVRWPVRTAYPNLASLRIVISNGDENDTLIHSFEPLTKLRHLQYLSMTTPHDMTWNLSDSRLTMSPFLRRMESLQHLRVDIIWLADRSNPSRLFQIASFLPPSIKSLHLLDYWGISMTSTRRDRHPAFPDDMTALEFMHCLREVKLSSREFAWERSRTTATRASLHSLARQFWRAGIRLTMTGLKEARDEEEGWWLDLD
ncbi:hypothetical protein F5B21DRAFT_526481 [Xylaria acuta]|nr:hypothetical protein F5B21DRAFT_526481 [Xylaria acuta]